MIKIDSNYSIETSTIHGFVLAEKLESLKNIKGVDKKVIRIEKHYYPKLSQCLEKYVLLELEGIDLGCLIEKTVSLEKTIERFSNTFAIKGKAIELV